MVPGKGFFSQEDLDKISSFLEEKGLPFPLDLDKVVSGQILKPKKRGKTSKYFYMLRPSLDGRGSVFIAGICGGETYTLPLAFSEGCVSAPKKAFVLSRGSQVATPDHPYLIRKRLPVAGDITLGLDGSLEVPILSADGEIVGLQRIYPDGSKKHAPGSRLGVWGVFGSPRAEGAILCEGVSDVLAVRASGVMHDAYASLGAGNLTQAALILAICWGYKRIVIVGDSDKTGTGQVSACKAKEAVSPFCSCTIWIPTGDDVDVCDLWTAGEGLLIKKSIEESMSDARKTEPVEEKPKAKLRLPKLLEDLMELPGYGCDEMGEPSYAFLSAVITIIAGCVGHLFYFHLPSMGSCKTFCNRGVFVLGSSGSGKSSEVTKAQAFMKIADSIGRAAVIGVLKNFCQEADDHFEALTSDKNDKASVMGRAITCHRDWCGLFGSIQSLQMHFHLNRGGLIYVDEAQDIISVRQEMLSSLNSAYTGSLSNVSYKTATKYRDLCLGGSSPSFICCGTWAALAAARQDVILGGFFFRGQICKPRAKHVCMTSEEEEARLKAQDDAARKKADAISQKIGRRLEEMVSLAFAGISMGAIPLGGSPYKTFRDYSREVVLTAAALVELKNRVFYPCERQMAGNSNEAECGTLSRAYTEAAKVAVLFSLLQGEKEVSRESAAMAVDFTLALVKSSLDGWKQIEESRSKAKKGIPEGCSGRLLSEIYRREQKGNINTKDLLLGLRGSGRKRLFSREQLEVSLDALLDEECIVEVSGKFVLTEEGKNKAIEIRVLYAKE